MQQLKLKRLKKKKDMRERRTTYCHGFYLNDDYITFTIDKQNEQQKMIIESLGRR